MGASIEARLQRSRTRLVLAIMVSLLQIGAGEGSLGDHEPAARAPLPPPLPSTASKLRTRQGEGHASALASQRGQIDADVPVMVLDGSATRVLRHKHTAAPTSHHGAPAAAARSQPARTREGLVRKAPPHRSGRGLAYNGSPERNRSQAGHISPPNDYRESPPDPAAAPSTGPLAGPVPRYYSFPGPPMPDYAPGYSPYSWPPPGLGFYR